MWSSFVKEFLATHEYVLQVTNIQNVRNKVFEYLQNESEAKYTYNIKKEARSVNRIWDFLFVCTNNLVRR